MNEKTTSDFLRNMGLLIGQCPNGRLTISEAMDGMHHWRKEVRTHIDRWPNCIGLRVFLHVSLGWLWLGVVGGFWNCDETASWRSEVAGSLLMVDHWGQQGNLRDPTGMWIQCWPFSQWNLITSVGVCSWCEKPTVRTVVHMMQLGRWGRVNSLSSFYWLWAYRSIRYEIKFVGPLVGAPTLPRRFVSGREGYQKSSRAKACSNSNHWVGFCGNIYYYRWSLYLPHFLYIFTSSFPIIL